MRKFSAMKGHFYYALSLQECASDQSAIFVGSVVGFLNVLVIRLRSFLLAPLKRDSSNSEFQFTA
jgi:hypothetical protein